MATAHDVAAYVLKKHGPMSAMKLQKLVYYCQAWSLVWEDHPLFDEQIQAWANGPVVYDLYDRHRGEFSLAVWPWGDETAFASEDAETIDIVLGAYGPYNAQQLSDMTHSEAPWRDARNGVPEGAPCSNEITHAAMAEYYGSL
jgi:uncharacterized phage-associated protein